MTKLKLSIFVLPLIVACDVGEYSEIDPFAEPSQMRERLDEKSELGNAEGCLHTSITRNGDRLTGYAIDLCSEFAKPASITVFAAEGTAIAVNSWESTSSRAFDTCQYFRDGSMECSANQEIEIEIDGTTYMGRFGFDVMVLGGTEADEYAWQEIEIDEIYAHDSGYDFVVNLPVQLGLFSATNP